MHDSRVMWFYSVFGVTVIKSHLCVYSCVFYLTIGSTKKQNQDRLIGICMCHCSPELDNIERNVGPLHVPLCLSTILGISYTECLYG